MEEKNGRRGRWRLQNDAMYQLDQLNAMRRQQDINYWSSSAVFGVATVYLLLAALGQATDKEYVSMALTGFLGLVVSFFWLAVVKHANDHGNRWRDRARTLQNDYGIPPQYRIWADCPPGIVRSWESMVLVITGSSLVWYTLVAYACLLTSLIWLVFWVAVMEVLILVFRLGFFRTFLLQVAEVFEEFWSSKSMKTK